MDDDYIDLYIDEFIWVIFIILSVLNIYGDRLEEENIIFKNNIIDEEARDIFLFSVIVSLLIYIYLGVKNYNNIEKAINKGLNVNLYKIRFIGSIFVILGSLCSLYFQINSKNSNNPTIE